MNSVEKNMENCGRNTVKNQNLMLYLIFIEMKNKSILIIFYFIFVEDIINFLIFCWIS